jgi:hypothetical protein
MTNQYRRDAIVLKVVSPDDFHYCGYGVHSTMSWSTEKKLQREFGPGNYTTMKLLREKNSFFRGRVGILEKVTLEDDITEVNIVKPLSYRDNRERRENSKRRDESILPGESASCVTPRPSIQIHSCEDEVSMNSTSKTVISQLSTQLAKLTTDFENLQNQRSTTIGDYTKDEYEIDLGEAFKSSGVVIKDGQFFLPSMPYTAASEMVPQMTVDKRLNFLIRLHTGIFKVIPNGRDYPKPGILIDLKNVHDGVMICDHPSFDLLQIVLTDTIDWQHLMIKNNNFMLPVLEPGMLINERIIAVCLISLKTEYFSRWNSLVKDCVLPNDITDTTRWSDSHSPNTLKVTSRRPDLAIKQRNHERKSYRRHRKDSIF